MLLIQKLNITHNKKTAVKPARNDRPGAWGKTAITKNATSAILHHGKKRHATKLRKAIRSSEVRNFINSKLGLEFRDLKVYGFKNSEFKSSMFKV